MPEEKQATLNAIVANLKQVDSIIAIVLGGSYATGRQTETSDLDIGIYYSETEPFSIESIRLLAQRYAVGQTPTVTGFYEWGRWVNGGAWINTAHGKVDFLYRNIEQVKAVIGKAKDGEWERDFEQQPPYGFSSVIYLAETNCCIPLHDPDKIIDSIKADIAGYPQALKQTIIQYSLWSAEFTIWQAGHFNKKGDVYSTMGCLTRSVKNIVDALFAINELYAIGDKGAIGILAAAAKRPQHLEETIENILCADKHTINKNIDRLKSLFAATVALAKGAYKPFYKLL